MELFKIPLNTNYVLVHTDVRRGIKFPMTNRNSFLESHYKFLLDFTQEKFLFFPSFNYDCLKNGYYTIKSDTVQVGVLNEYIRWKDNYFRNLVPVFNFLSKTKIHYSAINSGDVIDPFGINSTFDFLFKEKSYLLHYGSDFNSSTILHYIERISGRLVYRYDKIFSIDVIDDGAFKNVKLNYHVRPLNFSLNYDWVKLKKDLKSENLIDDYHYGRTQISGIRIENLVNFWLEKLNEDPLYLLDVPSRYNVSKKLDDLGSNFELKHFE
jgi:aminoglycoside N3'-acetyltransferase